MSSAVNSVNIIGRLGRDPEMRYTPSGKPVTNMNVAINERYGDDERTTWIRVVAWNATAEACNTYLAKGSQVAVSGRLQSRSYEKNGQTVYVTEVVANHVTFLSPPPDRGEDAGEASRNGHGEPALTEENIPF